MASESLSAIFHPSEPIGKMDMPEKPSAIDLPEQLRLLENNGAALIRRRQHEDAERIFLQIVAAAPRHVPALRYLASRSLARGELEQAQKYLERALRVAPGAPMLHQNLGIVLRARGYMEGSLLAFDTALKIKPDLTMAWIQRGDILQALGRREEALHSYLRAEELSGGLRGLARASRDAPRTRRAIRRAAVTLARAREAAVAEALAALRLRHEKADLIRVDGAIRTMTRAARPVYADPLQRPSWAYFPNLPAQPFFDRGQFPFLTGLEAKTDVIREELYGILSEPGALSPYVAVPEEQEGIWRELNRSTKWSSYHLYRNGERVEKHAERCRRTLEAVEALPLVWMQGQAPEVFFSILEPRTHIPPHFGTANYKLAVHLPLVVPSGCALRVGDRTRGLVPGKCIVFDDSFEHEEWNRSDEIYAVLTFGIWNPEVSEPEREALQVALAALNRFHLNNTRAPAESTGISTT